MLAGMAYQHKVVHDRRSEHRIRQPGGRCAETGSVAAAPPQPPAPPSAEYQEPITERFQIPEGRRWISNHLRELADRLTVDFEIIGFDCKWDSYNERFEATFTYLKQPGEPVPERRDDTLEP